MDLLAYLRILRRRWALILAVAVAGAVLGSLTGLLASSSSGGNYHKATHVLFFDPEANSDGSSSSIFTNIEQFALFTTSGDVPDNVGKRLGEDGRSLAEHVLVTTNSLTNTLEITAAARTAEESEDIADTFAEELIDDVAARAQTRYEDRRDQILTRLDGIQQEINGLDAQLANLATPNRPIVEAQRDSLVNQYRVTYEQFQQLAENSTPLPPLTTLELAEATPIGASEYNERLRRGQLGENLVNANDTSEDSPGDQFTTESTTFDGPVSRGVLGGLLGLMGGIGLALVAERLDRRLRTRQEVEDAYGLPVLAEIPLLTAAEERDEEVVSYTEPMSRTAEAHRAVRSSLLFQHLADQPTGDDPRSVDDDDSTDTSPYDAPLVVLVTSAVPNEGKSTTSANLAAVFAEAGASVLAVNCDFRRPTLHRMLGAPDEARRVLETNIPGVKLVSGVMTDPMANPAKVIAAQRRVVAAARDRFDVVLLDTAPILTTNDAIEIMGSVDLVVVVARPEVTTGDGVARARNLLERVQAPMAGIVLVGDESVPSDPYYYYSRQTGQAAVGDEPVAPDEGEARDEGGDDDTTITDEPNVAPVAEGDAAEPGVLDAPGTDAAATEEVFGDEDDITEGIPAVVIEPADNGAGDAPEAAQRSRRAKKPRRVKWKAVGGASKRSR